MFSFSVLNSSSRTEVSVDKSEADKLVDKIDFGELCNEFECTSSPQVESTARQLARDILEIRESNRAFACYAVSVKFKVHFPSHFYIYLPSSGSLQPKFVGTSFLSFRQFINRMT